MGLPVFGIDTSHCAQRVRSDVDAKDEEGT